VKYDQRDEHGAEEPYHLPTIREALEPYLGVSDPGPFVKLSISLPEPLIEIVREVARETGESVSGVVAASLRRLIDEIEQAKLDAALEADREENLAWARATAPMNALLLKDVEW
jgi:Arc/MetJ-type ribon-helix-helix transcriptional regulator